MTTKVKRKSVKLENSAQIDGKSDEVSTNVNKLGVSLDAILGENLGVYSAASVEEYKSQISDMNQTDLQSHAYKVGLVPIEDRRVLVGRLVQEFERWHHNTRGAAVGSQTQSIEDLNDRARKILREGA